MAADTSACPGSLTKVYAWARSPEVVGGSGGRQPSGADKITRQVNTLE